MGTYLRNNRYYFKKQIDGRAYYVALKVSRGQEYLLSARVKQAEDEILARHFNLPPPTQRPIGFADYCYKYLEQKRHKKTFDRDKQRLLKVIKIWGNPGLSIIGKTHVKRLEDELFALGRKAATVNRYFELLSHLFNLAIEDRYIQDNPCKYYQRFVEDYTRRSLTKQEIARILKVAFSMQKKPRNGMQYLVYDLILLGLNTGMRLSEMLFLKYKYINNNIILYPILYTKYKRRIDTRNINKTVKIIYLNNLAKKIIHKYTTFLQSKESSSLPNPPYSPQGFPSSCHALHATSGKALHPVTFRDKKPASVTSPKSPLHSVTRGDFFVFPMTWRNPNAVFRTVCIIRKRAKVPDFSFHQLRHTISTWVAARSSLSMAKNILGHADIRTTLRYVHPEVEMIRQGVAKIGTDVARLLPK